MLFIFYALCPDRVSVSRQSGTGLAVRVGTCLVRLINNLVAEKIDRVGVNKE